VNSLLKVRLLKVGPQCKAGIGAAATMGAFHTCPQLYVLTPVVTLIQSAVVMAEAFSSVCNRLCLRL
jgi:hypothetical protein